VKEIPRTTVKSHDRKGTKGVKKHSRSITKKKRTPARKEQMINIDDVYESLGARYGSLSDNIRKLEDKHWNMRVTGAVDGALPIVSMEIIDEQIDQKKAELEKVEYELKQLKPFRGQKITFDRYKQIIKKKDE